jgi:hypothetical protein
MPRGPIANWNRHQYKKVAMLVYVIAALAGSRGNVGKLCPAGHGQSDQRTGAETGISGFHFNFSSGIGIDRHKPVFQTGIEGALSLMPVHHFPGESGLPAEG